jgi:succinate dehydrogenase/fumarate reductase flavoprotein subunit
MSTAEQFDVIVLGSGIAGLATALAAAQRGLSAVVIEKADCIGGSSTESYGIFWVGCNHLAAQAGYADNREDVIAYMNFTSGGDASAPHLEAYVDRSPEALAFFSDCGVSFSVIRDLPDHYYGIAPGARAGGRSLQTELISGAELGDWRDKVRKPEWEPSWITIEEQVNWGGVNRSAFWDQSIVARRKREDMRGKGHGAVCQFLKALLDRNVPVLTGVTVDRLLTKDGAVMGVRTSNGDSLAARKGVVLATGGYESNPVLVQAFEGLPGWHSTFPASVTGDGLVLATENGAAIHLIRTNLAVQLCFAPPELGRLPLPASIVELCSPHTLVVNRSGKRFADESFFQDMVPALRQFDAMTHDYTNLPAFLIFDGQYAAAYSFANRPPEQPIPNWVARDATIAGLATQLGIDAAGLAQTIDRFNGFARDGKDDDFHRGERAWKTARVQQSHHRNASLGSIAAGPFYGVRLHPTGGGSAGVLTNARAQVLHQRRHPIPGLYAIGMTAAKIEFGAGYQAGYHLTSGMTFGFLAVNHMIGQP